MNGKKVLDSLDLDDHESFDGKDLFDLEGDVEFLQFVRQTNSVRLLQQSWPQSGMHTISSAQDEVCERAVNEMITVSSVRVRALRGSVFYTQREGRRRCQ
jgi:hypothetical protein